jgi:hypothetical protein
MAYLCVSIETLGTLVASLVASVRVIHPGIVHCLKIGKSRE